MFMKKIFNFSTVLLLFSITSLAQSIPMDFNYQGVARNTQGQVIANSPIKVRATLMYKSPFNQAGLPTTFYTETRLLTTNQLGMFSFKINDGTASNATGSINNGNWISPDEEHFLKIELDVNNSGTWSDMGMQKLSAVPYALYAKTAIEATKLVSPPAGLASISTVGQTVPIGATLKVTYEAEESGTEGFNFQTSEYTAKNSGLHFFSGTVLNTTSSLASGDVYIMIYVNGAIKKVFRYGSPSLHNTHSFNANIYLNTGDKVSIYFKNNLNMQTTVGDGGTFLNGFAIR